MEKEQHQRELIDKLETSDKNPFELVAKSKASALKKANARAASTATIQSSAKLLRSRAIIDIPDVPHVPYNDNWYTYDDKFQFKPGGYHDFFSEAVRRDREGIMRGGGYAIEEAWGRALRFAVADLELEPLIGLPQPSSQLDASGDVVMANA